MPAAMQLGSVALETAAAMQQAPQSGQHPPVPDKGRQVHTLKLLRWCCMAVSAVKFSNTQIR